MALIRTFIAIKIPEDIRNQIVKLQSGLRGVGGKISWVKPENIHLTLKFLGETDENLIENISEKLEQVVLSFNQFEVSVKGVGAFPNFRRAKVFWVGTKADSNILGELAQKIDREMNEFGYMLERRQFSAHLTIGRVRDNRGIEQVINKLQQVENFTLGKFLVKEVLFIKSELTRQGPIYTLLKKININ
jgi:2'-5' RNA ligase